MDKKKVLELLNSGRGLSCLDIAGETGIGAEEVVMICRELMAEGYLSHEVISDLTAPK